MVRTMRTTLQPRTTEEYDTKTTKAHVSCVQIIESVRACSEKRSDDDIERHVV